MIKLEKVSKFKKQPSKQIKDHNRNYFTNQQQKNQGVYQQQYNPSLIKKYFIQQHLTYEQIQKHQQQNYFNRHFENATLTYFIYSKISLIRYIMMSFGLISIFLSILSDQLKGIQQEILILHSLISVSLVIMVIVKYFLVEQLKTKQLLRQKTENHFMKFLQSTWIQILILIIHPNLLIQSYYINVSQPINDKIISLNINTILEIIMQMRIYLLYLNVINSSMYCNTRAHRLCRIYSTKSNLIFGIKSLFEYQPLTFLIILYLGLITSYAQMISLSQRDIQQDFADFQNSIWIIIITMGTVGYGDYSPQTYLGRIICFSAAISGIIISSLLILTLSRYLSMSNGQNKSHVTLKRLQLRKQLQKFSKQTINFTTNIILSHPKLTPNNNKQSTNQNKKIMEELKKKNEKVKFAIRRIKNMVDTDNLKEQINRLFQALAESLNQIYKFQEQYCTLLVQLYQQQKDTINQIQFSFTTQIQNIIKDR